MIDEDIAKQSPDSEKGDKRAVEEEQLLTDMRKGYDDWCTLMQESLDEARDDIDMLAGKQWPDSEMTKREQEERPCLTFNKLSQFHDNEIGAVMQQSPSMKLRPADGIAGNATISTAEKKELELVKFYSGLVRYIERTSRAEQAYMAGYEGASGWGFGFFRVNRGYVADSFDQELGIEPIIDPFSVAFDPHALDYTRESAMWAIVRKPVGKAEFKRRWPGAITASFDFSAVNLSDASRWMNDEEVILAEYFRKVPKTYKIYQLSDNRVVREPDMEPGDLEALKKEGVTVTRERKHDGYEIEYYLCSAIEVLEGPIPWPGQYLPIIPVWGRMLMRNRRPLYRGLIRNAKDEARSYNYARTAVIEKLALAPKTPWIIADEQVEDFRHIWETANTATHAYLPYKAIRDDGGTPLPPPRREMGQTDISGIVEQVQLSEQGMKSSIGIYDPSLGQRSNETSGIAIERRQQQGDTMTYSYTKALARSIEHAQRILIDLIPYTYDGTRVQRIIHEDGSEDEVQINQIIEHPDGTESVINDVTIGRFELATDIGPNMMTQRMEASDWMLRFVEAIPASGPFAADLIALNADAPGAQVLAERLKKGLVPPQVLDEDPSQEIPPQVQAQMQQLQQGAQQLQQVVQQQVQALQEMQAELQTTKAKNEALDIENRRVKAQADIDRQSRALDDQKREIEAALADHGKAQGDTQASSKLLGEQAAQNQQMAEALANNTAALQAIASAVAQLKTEVAALGTPNPQPQNPQGLEAGA